MKLRILTAMDLWKPACSPETKQRTQTAEIDLTVVLLNITLPKDNG